MSGVIRCFRPFPWQLTYAPAARWTSTHRRPISSDARRPVCAARPKSVWSRARSRSTDRGRSGRSRAFCRSASEGSRAGPHPIAELCSRPPGRKKPRPAEAGAGPEFTALQPAPPGPKPERRCSENLSRRSSCRTYVERPEALRSICGLGRSDPPGSSGPSVPSVIMLTELGGRLRDRCTR